MWFTLDPSIIYLTSKYLFFCIHRIIAVIENGVKLRLNIVDTPGYGDQVNNENW